MSASDIIKLPDGVQDFWSAYLKLKSSFPNSGLAFTPDGKLVGDIGEAVAAAAFGLNLCENKVPGVDAYTIAGKRSVQIKATGKVDRGPAFSRGEGIAEYLIFLELDLANRVAYVRYNGPEKPVRDLFNLPISQTSTASRSRVLELNLGVASIDRLPRVD